MRADPRPNPDYRLLDLLAPVAVAGIVLLIGLVQPSIKLDWTTITAGIALGLLSAGLGYIGAAFCFRRLSKNLTTAVLLAVAPNRDPDYSRWLSETLLVTDDELAAFEQSVDCGEIWVQSNDLHLDVPRDDEERVPFDRIVRHNIKHRNIRYVYILPDQLLIKRKVNNYLLAGLTSRERERIRVVYLNDGNWNQLPYIDGDFAIYNPRRTPETPPAVVYFEVPHPSRSYWCILPNPVAERWIARICEIIPDIDPLASDE